MIKFLAACQLLILALMTSISSAAFADGSLRLTNTQMSVPDCIEKSVWQKDVDGRAGKFIKVKECKISCKGGTTSTTCRSNETCNCECRSSGLPACSCHPSMEPNNNVSERLDASVKQSASGVGSI